MADIATLGIAVNTGGVSAADAALDRLAKAALDATNAVNRMTAAALANATQAGGAAPKIVALANAHNTLANSARTATAAHGAHAGAMMNSRFAAMEFEHSIRSIIDGLGAGMSPMRLFAMEGSRLAQAYQMSGGAAGVLSMFGGVVSKVMNPTVALTGAVVALGAGGIYAFNAWEARLNALQLALNGLGRSTGLTLGGLNQLATQSAGGRTSSSQAADAITAFTATGKIGPGMMSQLTAPQAGQQEGLVQQFSQATGASFSESVKTLAADFADPTKGAEALNKQFGLLSDNELQLITRLDAGGDRLGAQGKLLDDLRGRIQGAADVTSIWARAWGGVSTAASAALATVGSHIFQTPEDELAMLTERNRQEQSRVGRVGPLGAALPRQSPGAEARDVARERELREQIASNAIAASWQGFDQIAKEKSRDIGDITRGAIPDIGSRQSLLDQRNNLQTGMDTPGALSLTDAAAAQDALDRLNARLANFATATERVTQDSAFSAAAIMAGTATQRTAIEAQKSWLDVMRDTGNAALAAATATAKWNMAIAESQKAADDQTRKVDEAHGLIGLHGLDRQIQEINQRYDERRRNSVPGGVSSIDMGMTALDSSPFGGLDHGGYFPPSLTLNPGATGPWAQRAGIAAAASAPRGWPAGTSGGAAPAASTAGYLQPALDSNEKLALAQQKEVADVTRAAVDNLSDSQQKSLDASRRTLDVQMATWGQSSEAIAAATEKVRLYNEEIASGGQRLADAMAKQNDAFAKQAGELAAQQERVKDFTDTMSGARGGFRDLAGTVGDDLLNHKGAGDTLRDLRSAAAQHLMSFGVDQFTNLAFGKPSQGGGGGVLGGALGGLFGGGGGGGGGIGTFANGLGAAPVFAAANSNAGAGGILGGLLGGIGSLFSGFHFAEGGVMTPNGPAMLPRFADGGVSSSAAIFGEKGPEAAVPLSGGRAIPVAIKGGGGTHVTNHVGGHTIVVQGNADSKAIDQMKAEMAQANKDQMAMLQRNIGQMQGKWSQRYGS